MPDTPGSLTRRAATAACLTLIVAARAYAQSPAPPPPAPDFLTRYDFHLAANVLAIDDPRFSWETHFGGDLDLVDYVAGRASMLVDYQAILGDQLRPFDPNQSYYVLEASSSYRAPGVEIACDCGKTEPFGITVASLTTGSPRLHRPTSTARHRREQCLSPGTRRGEA